MAHIKTAQTYSKQCFFLGVLILFCCFYVVVVAAAAAAVVFWGVGRGGGGEAMLTGLYAEAARSAEEKEKKHLKNM